MSACSGSTAAGSLLVSWPGAPASARTVAPRASSPAVSAEPMNPPAPVTTTARPRSLPDPSGTGPAALEDVEEDFLNGPGHHLGAVPALVSGLRGGAEPAGSFGFAEEAEHPGGDRVGVAHRHHQPGFLVRHHLPHPADLGHHRWLAERHSLGDSDRQ